MTSDRPGDAATTIDSGGEIDSGAEPGPVVCSVVPCTPDGTCTALGCGSCNTGQKKYTL